MLSSVKICFCVIVICVLISEVDDFNITVYTIIQYQYSGYARAEVDRVVVKDADNFEYRQELEYRYRQE